MKIHQQLTSIVRLAIARRQAQYSQRLYAWCTAVYISVLKEGPPLIATARPGCRERRCRKCRIVRSAEKVGMHERRAAAPHKRQPCCRDSYARVAGGGVVDSGRRAPGRGERGEAAKRHRTPCTPENRQKSRAQQAATNRSASLLRGIRSPSRVRREQAAKTFFPVGGDRQKPRIYGVKKQW